MEPIGPRITGVEHRVGELKEAVERMVENQSGNQNVTRVVVDGGLGSVAVGIAIGAVIMGSAWIASTLSNIYETMRNNEAFIQATYQQAPEIRERFDQIKAAQAKTQEPHK